MLRLFILFILISTNVFAAAPARQNSYVPNTVIASADVTANENAIFNYLQAGVDTYADSSIFNADISASANIQSDKLNLTSVSQNITNTGTINNTGAITATSFSGKGALPSGAIFFLISGSCPSWSTDVSSTYSNKFVRINATAASTGGSDTHTHTAGSYAVSGTTGTTSDTGGAGGSGASGVQQYHTHAFSANVSGASSSGDNVPSYVTLIMCQVN